MNRFVRRMAWRETRGSRRRLLLLTGAVAAGVAALVAVNSFAANLQESVTQQAQTLLGADLSISSRRPFTPRVAALLDTLVAPDPARGRAPGRKATVVSFAGMVYVPHTEGVRLVQVAAVEPGYPFYGTIRTDPDGGWSELQEGGRVLVDPSLLTALDAGIGDTLRLGESRFVISATVLSQPGNVAVAASFSPRIFISAADLAATGLLRFGSRVEYETFLVLADPDRATAISEKYRPILRPERTRIRSVEENRSDLTEALTQLSDYLGLVALIALLLGGMGVASAVHVFIRQKLDTIAVLRCLGAETRQLFAIYLLQALAMGALGSLIGAGLGGALQQVLPLVLADLLPVDVRVRLDPGAVALGVGVGIWVAAVFALLPLLRIRRVSPLMALRRDVEPFRRGRDPVRLLAALALAGSIGALAVLQAGGLREGAGFTAGAGAAVLLLWLASLAMIRGVRRWFPSRWPYVWRQGLANLHRPANQTVAVVLSLGFGTFLLSTLFLVQHNLLRDLRVGGEGQQPNLGFIDIQPDQREGMLELLRAEGIASPEAVPMIPMRISSVKGEPVVLGPPGGSGAAEANGAADDPRDDPDADDPGARPGWAFRHEYRSTYRDTLVDSETLVEGTWWDGPAPSAAGPVDVSLTLDIASELDVTVGDEIVWDVQGVRVASRVANLRRVDWARFEPNFFAVFRGGVLDQAPQFFVALVRAEDPATRGLLQRRTAERYPNVTSLDLSSLRKLLDDILSRVALAVRFMAGFSLATGAVVLVGAIATTRFQRVREAVLLKTLGATRKQILRVFFAEYAALGLLSAGMAVALSGAAGWVLSRFVFETSYAIPYPALAALLGAIVLLTVGIGLGNSLDILRRTPLDVLRSD
ncbi:MAG: FtsX-like permease family protein [Gemmatimonadota bacterium]